MKLRRLRPWQISAFQYCLKQPHPALFMEMRLGKTLVIIRRIKLMSPPATRVLVVAPSVVLYSWEHELKLEGIQESDIARLTSSSKQKRKQALRLGKTWNLINKEGFLALPELVKEPWDAVIIDESVCLKNPKAKITRFFLYNFRKARLRAVLSGLPNPEQAELDLWPQLAFLDGHAFGYRSYWDFRVKRFTQPPWGFGWEPIPGTPSLVRKTLAERAFILRRRDVKSLPDSRVYETHVVEFPEDLAQTYEKVESDFILEYNQQEVDSTVHALAKYTWLRRIACGWVGLDLVWNGKFQALLDLHGLLGKQQYIVWFAFNDDLKVADMLYSRMGVSHTIMLGEVPDAERGIAFKAFDTHKVQVMLLQIQVAQYGIDLSVADTAVYFTNTPSLNHRKQSEERIYNPMKQSPLLYIDIVTKGTVDSDIANALQEKFSHSDMTFTAALRQQLLDRRAT